MKLKRSKAKSEPQWPASLEQLLNKTAGHTTLRVARELRLAPWLRVLQPLPYSIIKVAGTNGKGSVCAMLEAILAQAGAPTGCFTSPHLFEVGERFRVNGLSSSSEKLEPFAAAWKKRLEQVSPAYMPTFFEILMLLALDLFKAENVKFAIFEAGIGGRDDATRVLEECVAVITSVGLDHGDHLGHTLASVAAHKSAICRDGGDLVYGLALDDSARKAIEEDSNKRQITLHPAKPAKSYRRLRAGWATRVVPEADVPALHLPLAGRHQRDNLQVVLEVVRVLHQQGRLEDTACMMGVRNTYWPGRLQRLKGKPQWILDVAHNPEGLSALIEALDDLSIPFAERVLVYGAAQEKDLPARTEFLARLAPRVIVVGGFHRAMPAAAIQEHLPTTLEIVTTCDSPQDAYLQISQLPSQSQVLITGSVFLVGAFLALRGAL